MEERLESDSSSGVFLTQTCFLLFNCLNEWLIYSYFSSNYKQMAPVWIFLLSGRTVIFCSCKKIYFLPGQPGLIFHRKGCIRYNPPQTKGRQHTIRNSIKKGKTFIGSKIIEGKQERNNH